MKHSDDCTGTGDDSDGITMTNDLILKTLFTAQNRFSSNYVNALLA